MEEKKGFSFNGYGMFVAALLLIGFIISQIILEQFSVLLFFVVPLLIIILPGFFMVQPNQAKVMTFFGSYVGTVKANGLRWTIPLFVKRTISLRIRNFESSQMKVNDHHGNPIEIATVVVWSVEDTAEASFEVDDYISFVNIQSESALRNMAISYPYDQHEEGQISLRSHPVEISDRLKDEIQDRLAQAGINVIEARISHLAYSPEIAQAMLQRQQAGAIIAKEQHKLVVGTGDGAVRLQVQPLAHGKSIYCPTPLEQLQG